MPKADRQHYHCGQDSVGDSSDRHIGQGPGGGQDHEANAPTDGGATVGLVHRVVTAGEESLAGMYTLTADDRLELTYPDGRTTRPEYRFTADLFALIDGDGAHTQVFKRVQ